MTPARSEPKRRKTKSPVAPYYPDRSRETASNNGCLSGFLLPPLAAVCVSLLLIWFVGGFANAPVNPEPAAGQPTSVPGGALSTIFTPEVQYWSASLKRWAAANNVDVNLAATVMQIESCGDPNARSSAGAMGLFQVMPFHFLVSENAYNPETNARRGLDYLRRSLQHARGDARLALAGYNGGIGVIDRAESTWQAETLRYVYWGYPIYSDASQNANRSTRLEEWYRIAGGGMCARARQRLGLAP